LETEDINEISPTDEMAICAPGELDRDEVTSALKSLRATDRALLLQTLEGYSVEEMARLGGCDKKLIYVRLFRARQRLRAIL
jgi:DNA-directed RNA polymerase specialized sigma24 family protein